MRGGGHFSGRLTAPLCFAGAICGQILERRGIYTGAHIAAVHGVKDDMFSRTKVTKEDILAVRQKDFPVINDARGRRCGTTSAAPTPAASPSADSLNASL